MIRIVGVRFRSAGKVYYFDPNGLELKMGDHVIAETSKGLEYGIISTCMKMVDEELVQQPLRSLNRKATAEDEEKIDMLRGKEKEALRVCREKAREHKLDMKVVDAEYSFDESKVLFYFTADGRVDFRNLVKDLAGIFHVRIELRQIGVRDETRMLGGIGICGRELCCATFLRDFQPVSIKMAKEQNLSLNPTKISGTCGRLMCCLKNEEATYEYLNARMPKLGEEAVTADGQSGKVVELDVLRQRVRVLFEEGDTKELETFPVADLTFRPKKKKDPSAQGKKAKAERAARGEKPERLDKGEKPERMDKGEKSERGDRVEKPERVDRGEKPERGDRIEKPERMDRGDKTERGDKVEKPERVDRIDKTERGDRVEKPERVDRGEKAERVDRGERTEHGVRRERPEKSERMQRPGLGRNVQGQEELSGRQEKGARFERREKNERSDAGFSGERSSRRDRSERRERTEHADGIERPERGERTERPERGERAEKPERGERTERPERGERTERPERGERTERPERSERFDKGERTDRRERSEHRRPRRRRSAGPEGVEHSFADGEGQAAGGPDSGEGKGAPRKYKRHRPHHTQDASAEKSGHETDGV